MKQSIGQSFILYFIIIFFVVTMVFILAFMSYMKAFRLNSGIAKALETYEGLNLYSAEEIARILTAYGYRISVDDRPRCPDKNGIGPQEISHNGVNYCLYEYPMDPNTRYQRYGIITYIYIDIPIVSKFLALPVYSETEKIYRFHEWR